MNVPSATETAVELAKSIAIRDIYILAKDAERNGKTLSEFIETLEVLKNKE